MDESIYEFMTDFSTKFSVSMRWSWFLWYFRIHHKDEGPGKVSVLHIRLGQQQNSLNANLSRIHITNYHKCNCSACFDAIRYVLACPIYLNERRTCDDININIETLFFGNVDYSYDLNSKMLGKVRTFKNQSKRFQGLVSNFSPKLLTFLLSVSESKCLLYVVLLCHYYMCIFCKERSSYKLAQVAVQSYWLCTIQYN